LAAVVSVSKAFLSVDSPKKARRRRREQSREREAQLSSKRSEIESLTIHPFFFVTADLLSWIFFCSDCFLFVVVVVVMLQLRAKFCLMMLFVHEQGKFVVFFWS
jgi:hypothetical protein